MIYWNGCVELTVMLRVADVAIKKQQWKWFNNTRNMTHFNQSEKFAKWIVYDYITSLLTDSRNTVEQSIQI